MEKYKFCKTSIIFLTVLVLADAVYVRLTSDDHMKCSYGERGSLTATCVNATPSFFKSTPYRFDHLDETLRCVNCSLQVVDSNTFDISGNHIKYLDLSYSKIGLLNSKSFVGLIFLLRLNLAHNSIKGIYPSTFSGVKKITHINIESNSINILSDDGFQELVALEELNVRYNHIKSIANRAFNGLANLKFVDLSHNEISEVKDVFNNLTSLKFLDLSYNKITKLSGDEEFGNLTNLAEVRFAHNYITEILASEFVGMEGLRRLDLSFNLLSKIQVGSFKALDGLEDLDLSYNNLAVVPQKTFQNLYDLKFLNLSNNKISIIQTGIYAGLPQLRRLNFSHNVVEEIEITGVFSLDSLDTLDVSYNNITYLDYISLISRLPKIAYLNIKNNLLGCDLDKEMEKYFAQDNFKFILYSNKVGDIKCIENPVTPLTKHKIASLVQEQRGSESSAVQIWIFVLIGFTLTLVCVLYYLQLRTYQEMRRLGGAPPQRTVSQAQLISSDLEARDNDYFNKE